MRVRVSWPMAGGKYAVDCLGRYLSETAAPLCRAATASIRGSLGAEEARRAGLHDLGPRTVLPLFAQGRHHCRELVDRPVRAPLANLASCARACTGRRVFYGRDTLQAGHAAETVGEHAIARACITLCADPEAEGTCGWVRWRVR